MRSLKQYIKDREIKRTGGMPESADFHSKGYHRYFEGYSEYKTLKPNGKTKINRIYTGVYHKQELSRTARIKVKIIYCACFLLACVFFVFSAALNLPSNNCWYVAVFEALSVASLLWVFYALFNYITSGENLTIYEYHQASGLKKSTKWAALPPVGMALATLVHIILNWEQQLWKEFICAALAILAAASCFVIHIIESRITYSPFLSKEEAPEESNQIDS